MRKLIISAYAVYPEIASSEGIVNKNWIDILDKKKLKYKLLTSQTNTLKNNDTSSSKYLKRLFIFYKSKKTSLNGVLYIFLNKTFKILKRSSEINSLYQYLWLKHQKMTYNKFEKQDSVVWVRVLPMLSVLPIINNKVEHPIVININDPLSLNNSKDEIIFNNTIENTQCWTFPSYKLAMQMANQYNLDKKRCFVIPHAMQKQEVLYLGNKKIENEKLKFVYTGTFYKTAFTEEFSNGLQKFCETEYINDIEFTFILSQYDNTSINWIKKAVPNAKILFKLSREEVLQKVKDADCMLVVDAISHQNLLKGKFVEAISFGIPILGITYKNSVMDNVIQEYGSVSAYQEIEDDIFSKLEQTYKSLKDDIWNKEFCIKRNNVMQKVSEDYIYKATLDISNYAYKRFMWENGKIKEEPESSLNYIWP